MYELFFIIALLVGVVGGFLFWSSSRDKQKGLIRQWKKDRRKS